ncbi:hypothetical protein D3C78_819690 [compost metagenome]
MPVLALGDERRTDSHLQRATARAPGAVRQYLAAAGKRHRHHRQTLLHGDLEGTEAERPQSWLRTEGALGEEQQRRRAAGQGGERLHILHALEGVAALDETGSHAFEQPAQQRSAFEFGLGDEADRLRQGGGQQQGVEIAGVIGDQHAWASGQPTQPGDPQRAGAEAGEQAEQPAGRLPALVHARQQEDGQHGERQQHGEAAPGPGGIEPRVQVVDAVAQPPRQAGAGQVQQLQPGCLCRSAEGAALEGLADGRPADLAAGGFQHAVWRRQHHHVRWQTELVGGERDDAPLQRGAGAGVAFAGFGDHHQSLACRRGGGNAEHRHAAAAHAGQLADRLLQIVGVEVAAAADDQVLAAPGDVQLAAGEIGIVAGHQPVVMEQPGAGRRVAVVAAGGRGAAKLQVADLALRQRQAGVVDDAQRVTGQRRTTGDEAQRLVIVGRRGLGQAAGDERLAHHPVDLHATPRWRYGQPHGGFGEAIGRRQDLAAQAIAGKAIGETLQGVRADRFGAIGRQAP